MRETCLTCGETYTESKSLRAEDFCSEKCELAWAEEEGESVLKVSGSLLKIGRIDGEKFDFPKRADDLIKDFRNGPMDLLTILNPAEPPTFKCVREKDNLAILDISTYQHWLMTVIDGQTRNRVRKPEKRGIEFRIVPLDDTFVRGIWDVYNETPIRQGKKFPHFGMTIDQVKEHAGTFPNRSIFIGVYLGQQVVGFARLVKNFAGDFADIVHFCTRIDHRDKSLNNGLMAKIVEVCEQQGIKRVAYDNFSYGKKELDSLADFKLSNGFKRVEMPRYWYACSRLGKIALSFGLHKRFSERLPESIAAPLRMMRTKLVS